MASWLCTLGDFCPLVEAQVLSVGCPLMPGGRGWGVGWVGEMTDSGNL
jgi:hypothetical protein